jgi:hypothetical protein
MAQQLNESTGGLETLMQNCPQYEGLLLMKCVNALPLAKFALSTLTRPSQHVSLLGVLAADESWLCRCCTAMASTHPSHRLGLCVVCSAGHMREPRCTPALKLCARWLADECKCLQRDGSRPRTVGELRTNVSTPSTFIQDQARRDMDAEQASKRLRQGADEQACDSAGPVPEASADHGASPADGAHPAAAVADEPLQDKPTAKDRGARALAAPDDPIAAHRTAEGTVEGPVAVLLRDDSLPHGQALAQ